MQGDEQYAECIISQSAVPLPTVLHHSTTTTVLFAIPCHPLSARPGGTHTAVAEPGRGAGQVTAVAMMARGRGRPRAGTGRGWDVAAVVNATQKCCL